MTKNQSTAKLVRPPLQVMGAKPAGVTMKVASGVERHILDQLGYGKEVNLLNLRFIPSTKVELGKGEFQILANSIVEGTSGRAQSVDTVVTVGRKAQTGQFLRGVKIPSLDRLGFKG